MKAGPPQPQPRRHPHPGPQPALHPGRHAPCQPPPHPPPRQPPCQAEADVGAKVAAPSVVAATTTSANLRNMTISRVGADSIIRTRERVCGYQYNPRGTNCCFTILWRKITTFSKRCAACLLTQALTAGDLPRVFVAYRRERVMRVGVIE